MGRSQQLHLPRSRHRLRAAAYIQLTVNVLGVHLDRANGEIKLVRDFLIG